MAMNNYKNENWKLIPGYEGLYDISNHGRVRSYYMPGGGKNKVGNKPKIMKRSGNLYPIVHLCKNGEKNPVAIHRLVAESFIPNPESKSQINHIDCDVLNNHVDNLEWVTPSENMLHAYENGLKTPPFGENQGNSRLKSEDVLEIRRLCDSGNLTNRKIAELYDIDPSHVSKIKTRDVWKHI